MSTKTDRLLVVATSAFFLLASIAVVLFTPSETQVIDTQGHPTLGSAKAPVEVVIFEDLKCVWCAHFSKEVLPQLKKKYIDTGKIRYTIILLAFLPGSKPAGNAALEVYRQNSKLFFPFVDAIYANQPPEDENWAKDDVLKGFASKVPGIDVPKMIGCMKMGTYNKKLEENFEFAKEVMKDQFGTPTIYINGNRVEELDYEAVSMHIEEALYDKSS